MYEVDMRGAGSERIVGDNPPLDVIKEGILFGEGPVWDKRGIEGLCLDSGGNIVASGGWKRAGASPFISVFAPSGAVLESHVVPAELPMRCAFGGADLGDLYFTTGAGELYRSRIGRKGYQRRA